MIDLRRLIDAHGIEPHLWIDDRPTTWKQRIVARGQLRPDRCDREVTTPISDHAATIPVRSPAWRHGAHFRLRQRRLYAEPVAKLSATVLATPACRSWSIPLEAETGPTTARVTLIKANWAEATEAVGNHDIRPLALARRLADEHRCHVVVTIGRHGMVCAERDGATWYLPAEATEVRDVCGAGDTVLAAIGIGDAHRRLYSPRLPFSINCRQKTNCRYGRFDGRHKCRSQYRHQKDARSTMI